MGASTLLAPWIPLLNASGQEATLPRRLVLFFTPHGTVWEHWRPSGSETDFSLPRILSPLERFKQQLVVVDGVAMRDDGPGAPHTKGPALLFTASPLRSDGTFNRKDCSGGCTFGWNSGPSFDQVMARRLAGETPYKSLEFGVRSGGGFPGAHVIYAGDSTPVPPRQDPGVAFDALFGGADLPEMEAAQRQRRRRAVLGLVNSELARLEPRIARADRRKVAAHREALADLETQLFRPVPVCDRPARPERVDDEEQVVWEWNRQIELLVASLRCDLTRIASLQFRLGENDGYRYPYLGVDREHHSTTHDQSGEAQEAITRIYEHYADRFAYLLQLLSDIPEGDGTMLDHTLVLWASEVGTGWSHSFDEVPFVLAGGGKFGVRTGRYLSLPDHTYHNRILVSAMRFLGADDVEQFGATDQERGSLPGLGV